MSIIISQGRRKRMARSVVRAVALGAILVSAGVSRAQQDEPPLRMSLSDQVKKAEGYTAEMNDSLKSAFKILQDARQAKDIQQLLCINEALAAIKGLLRLSEQNIVMLHEASSKHDERAAEHEFVKISIAYNKVRELDGRVRSCGAANVDSEVDGRPVIDKVIDPDMPTEDPLGGIIEIPVDIPRPPSASPVT